MFGQTEWHGAANEAVDELSWAMKVKEAASVVSWRKGMIYGARKAEDIAWDACGAFGVDVVFEDVKDDFWRELAEGTAGGRYGPR